MLSEDMMKVFSYEGSRIFIATVCVAIKSNGVADLEIFTFLNFCGNVFR